MIFFLYIKYKLFRIIIKNEISNYHKIFFKIMYNNVYIKKSNIYSGLGIFAKKNINKNEIISWYYIKDDKNKKLKHKHKHKYNKYVIEYNCIIKKKYLIEFNDYKKLKGKGLAQLAIDAIYFGLTGKNNNSYFMQNGKYIFLLAYNNIKKDDEILVSHGMYYWMKQINCKYNIKNIYNHDFKKIIYILYYLSKLIKDYFLCDIYEIKNINNNYKIYFKLIDEKRWCINYNIWHYDEDFYISLKKDNKGLINIYYSCVTCKDNDYNFLIDKTDINIFYLNRYH